MVELLDTYFYDDEEVDICEVDDVGEAVSIRAIRWAARLEGTDTVVLTLCDE